jgi:hypothetical protein
MHTPSSFPNGNVSGASNDYVTRLRKHLPKNVDRRPRKRQQLGTTKSLNTIRFGASSMRRMMSTRQLLEILV